MLSPFLVVALLASAGLIEGAAMDFSRTKAELGTNLVLRQAEPTCLKRDTIQSASALTGQEEGTDGIKPGQAPSETDDANFVNFCSGQQLTNGMQITSGSCNGIPMGRIPASENMISAMITNPQPGDKVPADTTFSISVQTTHLKAGFFVNPTTNYYTAPQELDDNGDIIGHCHITVQDIGDLKSTTPPDPTKFTFFKGVDDDGNGKGLLQAEVEGGLPAGVYRVCTMIAARNHQPVNMPVAQRGAQDDCTKFEVVPSQNSGNSPSPNKKNGDGSQNQDEEGSVTSMPAGRASAAADAGNKPSSGAQGSTGDNAGDANQGGNGGNAGGNGGNTNQGGNLGGAAPPVLNGDDSRRPFSVNGNTFTNKATAVARSCDIQFNACADAMNGGKLPGTKMSDCTAQKDVCNKQA
ncbi:hypothetical protein V496_02073 [Pseudogymnoascus sp. VKM F-4515 (FW-2607)]|nr:hypothetical protein V496_02073 [Pseudogymnoascus sp. VKM F-4515 (FW-2607)]